jgi:hypothetical protein
VVWPSTFVVAFATGHLTSVRMVTLASIVPSPSGDIANRRVSINPSLSPPSTTETLEVTDTPWVVPAMLALTPFGERSTPSGNRT